ncbi:hemolysin family protein [Acholeplasma hippikon]|uniref:Mg2+ and Co2+ transporter CorB n=1 Tax=Acholeplasma hippikon TaxID=264636 RepID=A0A449BIR5_9MOLU|nr:hemolysin family protein [Acholeplasma hippikon]VEU82354.1 Putative Mg2+ and Co2+ transporter CorB [Acholeplasma hippikon]
MVNILLIVLVIVLNGIFASSEMAIVSANRKRVELDAEEGNKRAKKLLPFMEQPTRFLSTIQIGITMFGFINGAVASSTFSAQISSVLSEKFGVSLTLMSAIVSVLITLILTFFQVVLGELVPKRLAMKAPEKVAYAFIGFLSWIALIMRPFVSLLTGTANLIGKLFGINPNDNDDTLTEDELRLELNASELKGVIDKSENEMIQNIFEFDTTTVSEVMTHRTEVSAIELGSTKEEIISYVTSEKYTRFPVYEDSIDHIIGILHVKDLLRYIENKNDESFDLKSLLRDPLFVPSSKNTRQLFRDMQTSKVHIAIVIDEYGGTAGIVTFEDLIEEIVGNIFDEYDDEEQEISEIKDDEYLIEGLTNIDDVEDILNAQLPVEEYDTLSGFILGQLGRFPEEGEAIVIVYNNYRFEVLEYQDRVIEKVKVTRIQPVENNTVDED